MDVPLRAVPESAAAEGAGMAEEQRTFEEFFRGEHDRLFRALCLVTGSRQEAEEIMQDSFLKIWERWERVALMEDPSGYLYRIAMNAFRNRYRSVARALKRGATMKRADDAFAAVEDRDVVIRALRTLIPQQRAAVVLTSLLDYSSEEAGRMLGMKAATVRTLTTRARESMRQTVEDPR
jgi:RNA polymerase sigma-70 factor (ECF subfamily)